MKCVRCDGPLPEGARFCPRCGAEQATVAPREERKLVTILFVDQVGSTARADGADPEDVRDRNRLYYDEARSRLERFGGTLEKYAGDAVMAVFGAPLARSDDAERAVRAGLGILDGVRELNDRTPGLDLEVRIGISTGEAVVELNPPPESALATGDVVNTAARLETAAPPGGIVVGAETYRLTRGAFRFEELQPIVAKGKREPVPAWRVVEPIAQQPASAKTPLVGRDNELLLIRAVWNRAVQTRTAQLVSIVGPAGIGKSRLAREVTSQAEEEGARVLWGRSVPYEQQTPYHAIAQIVRRVAGIFENEPVEAQRGKLATLVEDLFGEQDVADATRFLSLALGLGLDQPAKEAIQIFSAIRRVLERLAEQNPLLLVFDDIHWADDALLELIAYLITRIQDHPVMLVGTARPEFLEERPAWASGVVAHTSIPLGPLAEDDARRVVKTLLGEHDTTIARVVATAEGNPLFLEELVASIGDDATDESLPASVRAVITARIDALPANARNALLRASVIGRTFWGGVLQRLGGVEDVDEALETLETRGLVQRRWTSQVEGETEFAFKHDLIRDAAYATLPRASRRELHATTASVLEDLVGDATEIAWVLAHHWREAGEAENAIRYLLVAAERARDALAVEQTHDLYSQAAALASTDARRRSVLLLRGVALSFMSEFGRAFEELGPLLEELEGDELYEGLIAYTRSAFWTERPDESFAASRRALELAREQGDKEKEAPALALLGTTYSMRGEPGDTEMSIRLCDEALEMWVPGTRRLQLAEIYHHHANQLYWAGEYDRALALARRAQETAGAHPGSEEALLRGAGLQGLVLAGMGRYEEAISIGAQAIAIAERIGRPKNVMTNYSTLPLREIFAVDEAARRSEAVAEALGPSDFNMPWMNARADLACAQLLAEDFGRLEKEWPSLWEDAVASNAWERWLISGRTAWIKAETDLSLGRVDDAMTWARRAIEMAEANARRKYVTIARTTLGRVLVAAGAAEEAVTQLRIAVAESDALGSPLARWQARAALANSLEATGSEPGEVRSEAASIVRAVIESLSPEHAEGYRRAAPVAELLAKA